MISNDVPRLICVCILSAGPAAAARDDSRLCDMAAADAAAEFDVPVDILLAITRVETGRGHGGGLHPWPWAINQGGAGGWFDTSELAITAAEEVLASGRDNVDIGCFQLNYRWHGEAFPSVTAMFDPVDNARYAAGFLADLYADKGEWPAAIAAYHSRTPEHANRYLARIETVLAGLTGADIVTAPEPEARENRFPLLLAGAQGANGSLVPVQLARAPLIGAP